MRKRIAFTVFCILIPLIAFCVGFMAQIRTLKIDYPGWSWDSTAASLEWQYHPWFVGASSSAFALALTSLAWPLIANRWRKNECIGSSFIGLQIAWLAAAVMLACAAAEKHDYSFYTLLRWICCSVFAYSATNAFQMNRVSWTWIFGVLAALYNPIFPVLLDRGTWVGVNWFTIGVIAVAAVILWRDNKKSSA